MNKPTFEQAEFLKFICEVNHLKKQIIEGKEKSDLRPIYVFLLALVVGVLFRVNITN